MNYFTVVLPRIIFARLLLAAMLFGFWISSAHAQTGCEGDSSNCAQVGEWKIDLGIGVGMRTNPVAGGDDIPLIILPSVSYYGKRFYFENLNFGYQLLGAESYDVNLILTPGRDHLFFNRSSLGNFSIDGTEVARVEAFSDDIPRSAITADAALDQVERSGDGYEYTASLNKRKLSVLAGLDLHYYLRSLSFGLQILNDVRGVHDGSEIRAAMSHQKHMGKLTLSSALGFIWQDASTIDYYYGIDADEVAAPSLAYQADSGISPFGRVDFTYKLNERWSVKATAYYRDLASSIEKSPIVNESGFTTVFFGGVYHF